MKHWVLAVLWAALALPALAQNPAPSYQSAQMEQRVMAIATELRCLVCQNESIAGSRASLAVDLRQQIREQVAVGKTDEEIMAYMVARYGDFVRYRPPLKATTMFLWFGPAILLAAGLAILLLHLRRRRGQPDVLPLSNADRKRAEALLHKSSESRK
ncbi:cytochrome c-type biogenesis protein [Herminiimonas aquatilis]|uniref:Cytochrome c-type biogenesis protein n=1 Tax=Herminiimonas aquatilis TaxID=345342 RepID=A0ABW2J7W1_9BURK